MQYCHIGSTILLAISASALLLTGCPDGSQSKIVAIDSMGNVERVDPTDPGQYGSSPTPTKRLKSNNLTWNIVYVDIVEGSGVGFDDPVEGVGWRAQAEAVLGYVSQVLNASNVVTLDVTFKKSIDLPGNSLANAGTFFFEGKAFKGGFAFDHIITGTDPSSQVVDIFCTIDPTHSWFLGTGTPSSTQYDFFTVVLHEMTHGLGFFSNTKADGSSAISGGAFTLMDKHIETGNGNDCWDAETVEFVGEPSYLTGSDGGLVFPGPHATAAFAGTPPPLYAPATFSPGSSVSHWDTGQVGGAVMEHALPKGTARRTYAPIDIGLLVDIGYVNAARPLPKADFSSAAYAVAENSGTVTITVTLSDAPGTGYTAEIDFATADGTAMAGLDYIATGGTLLFGASDTSKTFQVAILDDGIIEGDETFSVVLSNPVGCVLAGVNTPATVTILDDDVPRAEVWVDFGYTGIEFGTESQPFKLLSTAASATSAGGTVKIKGDVAVTASAEAPLTLSTPLRIMAVPAGSVRIGVVAKRGQKSADLVDMSGISDDLDALDAAVARTWRTHRPASDRLPMLQTVSLADAAAEDSAALIFEPVLPTDSEGDRIHLAAPNTPVFLRLRADASIDAGGLWAEIPGTVSQEAQWQAAAEGSEVDFWIRFAPGFTEADGVVALRAGGHTLGGALIAPGEAQFQVRRKTVAPALWQPMAGRDFRAGHAESGATEAVRLVIADDVPLPPGAIGDAYRLLPEIAFDGSVWVWVALPHDVSPTGLTLQYWHARDWYSAARVDGWLVPASFRLLEVDEGRYLGFRVRHAGVFSLVHLP